jgi:hypothetical protein
MPAGKPRAAAAADLGHQWAPLLQLLQMLLLCWLGLLLLLLLLLLP